MPLSPRSATAPTDYWYQAAKRGGYLDLIADAEDAATAPADEPALSPDDRADHCIAWIEAHCKVMSDTGQGPIPFLLYDHQKAFIRDFWHHRELIVLKARQIGMTETVAALSVYCIHQFAGWTIIILSQDLKTANEAMAKCRVAYDYLPDDVRVPVVNRAITSRITLVNRSRILVMPTTANSARSLNCQVLIIDEWARQAPHLQAQVYAAAAPAARSAGNRIVGMSTANGVGNFFHTQWTKARAGDSQMAPIFLPWSVRPGRDAAWYAQATSGMEEWQKAQELPGNEHEAFILSGRNRFDYDSLQAMVATAQAPLLTDWDGALEVWERPTEGGRYVMGVDTAEGLPKGDYSAAAVIDYHTGLDVACLHGHMPPEQFAERLAAVGRWYNDAYMGVERNNHGHAVLLALTAIHQYPALYYHQEYDATEPVPRAGWQTTPRSKPIMVDALAEVIRSRRPYRNGRFVGEALTYVVIDNGDTAASGDMHDDLVIAYALAEMMRRYAPPVTTVEYGLDALGLDDYAVDTRY